MIEISTLTLKNWRSFKDATIEGLGRLNVFGGLNRAGKSSVADAIRMLLTGSCRGSAAGRNQKSLRHSPGGKPTRNLWSVGADVLVARPDVQKDHLERRENEGPSSASHIAIAQTVGVPAELAAASLDTTEIFTQAVSDPRKAQALLLKLIKPGEPVELPADLSALLDMYGSPSPGALSSVADIERLYKWAHDLRADANRDLKHATVPLPKPPEGMEALEGMSLEKLREARSLVQTRITERRAEFDALEEPGDCPVDDHDLKDKEQAVVSAQDALEVAWSDERIMKEMKALEDTHGAARAATIKTSDRLATTDQALAVGRAQRIGLQKRIRDFSELTGDCPSCKRDMPPELLTALRDDSEVELAGVDEDIEVLKDTSAALQLKINESVKTEDGIGSEIDLLRGRLGTYAHLQDVVSGAREELAALANQKQEWKEANSEAESTKRLALIAELGNKIAEGDSRLRTLDTRIGQVEVVEKLREDAAGLQQRADELDTLVKAFGPGSELRAQLAGGDRTVEYLNDISERLGKFGFDLVSLQPLLEGEQALVDARPLALLSDSERLCFGVACQIVAAQLSGLGIVLVDNFDILVKPHIDRVQAMLMESDCQCFVFTSTRDPDRFYRVAVAVNSLDESSTFFEVSKNQKDGQSTALRITEEIHG